MDFRCARLEAEHVAGGGGEDGFDRIGRGARRVVADVERMISPRHTDGRAVAEEGGDPRFVDGGRHDHQAQIIPRLHGLFRHGDGEVGVDASFVELVDDDGREVGEQGILLKERRQNAFGGNDEARARRPLPVVTDMPPHLAAQLPALFVGDPACDCAGRGAAWLQEDGPAGIEQRRRHARRLSRSRVRDDDDRT